MLILRPKEVCPMAEECIYDKGIPEIINFCWGSRDYREHVFTCEHVSDGIIIRKDMEDFEINKINQVIDGRYVGYHEDLDKFNIKKGDKIIIQKGKIYHTMRDGNHYITRKTYPVKVNHLIHGAQYIQDRKKIVKNTTVVWVGSGGYWHSVDINNIL